MYTDGTNNLSHCDLQNRLNTSFPDGVPPAGWSVYEYHPPERTPAELESEILSAYVHALESNYDAAAQSRRYDNHLTCTLRAGYPGPFQAEGLAFATWMDECNAYAYGQMALVQADERDQPTPDELVAELPPMVWP